MRIVIIGSVAAGTSVAAKARRNDETAEIVVYEAAQDISYSVCGMPYFLGGEVPSVEELIPRDANWFKKRFEIDIHTNQQVVAIQPQEKALTIHDKLTGEDTQDSYDKLVIATGSYSLTPRPFDQSTSDNVFHVKTMENTRKIDQFMQENEIKNVTIVGSGFIGLEMAEQLTEKGIQVTIVELADQIFPKIDPDMSYHLAETLRNNHVDFYLNDKVELIEGKDNITQLKTAKGEVIDTDMVILAVGVRPNVSLAEAAGITLGETGAIKVNPFMQTSEKDIYAVGDVAESYHLITGKPVYHPLGSTANKMGRVAGDHITGGALSFKGTLGTGIFRLFDLTVAYTGLSYNEAQTQGYDPVVIHNIKPTHATYLGGENLLIKGVADRETGRVLGAQIVGPEGVDKRIDVLATAISFNANAEDLFHLDLAYAPPFSTTKDPVHYTGMVLENARQHLPVMTPETVIELQKAQQPLQVVDVRSSSAFEKGHVTNAVNMPMPSLRKELDKLDKRLPTVVYCNKGVTSNTAQNLLLNSGFKEVYVLSGGNTHYQNYQKSLIK
ncbi:FAD-dependent oxidoreductase [Marinilactibacillus kalidii]|uniref:FAD-dependent oxidoreductase n=1 Tax=Marinilactibacillus kalidii TaxID=2820274 RepID=UPI001ABE86B0|nr:FAD-dependent oxidoreductase [Marinilactibacillus kalidii]